MIFDELVVFVMSMFAEHAYDFMACASSIGGCTPFRCMTSVG